MLHLRQFFMYCPPCDVGRDRWQSGQSVALATHPYPEPRLKEE